MGRDAGFLVGFGVVLGADGEGFVAVDGDLVVVVVDVVVVAGAVVVLEVDLVPHVGFAVQPELLLRWSRRPSGLLRYPLAVESMLVMPPGSR